MDLVDLELDVTHNLVLDLDVGVGHIHLQLCITGTANQQSSSTNGHIMGSQLSQEETNWEQMIKKYVSIIQLDFLWCCVVMFKIPSPKLFCCFFGRYSLHALYPLIRMTEELFEELLFY